MSDPLCSAASLLLSTLAKCDAMLQTCCNGAAVLQEAPADLSAVLWLRHVLHSPHAHSPHGAMLLCAVLFLLWAQRLMQPC